MKRVHTLSLTVLIALTGGMTQTNAQTLSNRHQLSGCTVQSAPVVIPYAEHRSVRLGLPADLERSARIQEIHGYSEETHLRLRRNSLSLRTHGGSAVLTLPEETECSGH